MIYVKIGPEERKIGDAEPRWITQAIQGRRRDGQDVCVRIRFDEPNLNMVLSTPACGSTGGGGRPPNDHEREFFELWEKLHLNDRDFSPGNVVAFVQQLMN